MSLFSKTPTNRKRRPKKRASGWQWDDAPPAKRARKKRSGDTVEQVYALNAQIGAIENFLAGRKAARAVAERMKRDGVLPPPDRVETPRCANRRPVLSHAERRRYNAERSLNGIRFLLLFCVACGLAWWLIFAAI